MQGDDDRRPVPAAPTAGERAGLVVAVTIVAGIAMAPPVTTVVDELAPGWLPVWLGLAWLVATVLVGIVVERGPGRGG